MLQYQSLDLDISPSSKPPFQIPISPFKSRFHRSLANSSPTNRMKSSTTTTPSPIPSLPSSSSSNPSSFSLQSPPLSIGENNLLWDSIPSIPLNSEAAPILSPSSSSLSNLTAPWEDYQINSLETVKECHRVRLDYLKIFFESALISLLLF